VDDHMVVAALLAKGLDERRIPVEQATRGQRGRARKRQHPLRIARPPGGEKP
jgi:hypothetical protein